MAKPGRRPRPLSEHTCDSLRLARYRRFHPVRTNMGGWKTSRWAIGPCDPLMALLFGFKHSKDPEETEYLFWEIADLLWNKDPDDPKFEKHKWSHAIIHNACQYEYLAIGGAANVGKSYVCAGWAIVNWLSDPANTIVLVTSTDRESAKKRMWGCVKNLLDMCPSPPCKNQYSIGSISYWDGKNKPSSTAGIFLVTADKSKDKDKVGKLIGIHAPRVLLMADELSDISPNVQTAATGNLAKNPFFRMIGMSNPSSRFDPFGVFSTPKSGWESVNPEEDYEWPTKLNGLFMRIDSELSPNIDDTPNPEYPTGVFYPYLPTDESIAKDLELFGDSPEEARKSRSYLRFNRAVFYDSEGEDSVYSQSEFIKAGALNSTTLSRTTRIAACDPSFSMGGDSTVMVLIEDGFDSYGQHCVQVKELKYLYEDASAEDSRTLQIADKMIAQCKKWEVEPENFALDASSGAGKGLADMLQLQWGNNRFLRVEFGGAASSKKIKNDSRITGKDRYVNRASELFYSGRQYLIGRQLYGIPAVIADQMCKRLSMDPVKGAMGVRLQVEPKKLYKARVGKSPDETDAFLVACECARVRQQFVPADPVPQRAKDNMGEWLRNRRTHRDYQASNLGFVSNLSA